MSEEQNPSPFRKELERISKRFLGVAPNSEASKRAGGDSRDAHAIDAAIMRIEELELLNRSLLSNEDCGVAPCLPNEHPERSANEGGEVVTGWMPVVCGVVYTRIFVDRDEALSRARAIREYPATFTLKPENA